MAGTVLEITDTSFETDVLKSSTPVLVDFWAEWCGPCKMLAPTVEKLAGEYTGKLKVCKVNVDENPNSASKFGIQAIPTLLIFKNGANTDRIVGVTPEKDLRNRIEKAIV